jgi:hypothetical protein
VVAIHPFRRAFTASEREVGSRFELGEAGGLGLATTGFIPDGFLASYRAPPELLSRWVPEPFEVSTLGGEGFVSVLAFEVQRLGVLHAPEMLRLDSLGLLYSIGVRLPFRGEWQPTFLTLRLDVSSRALVFLGRRFTHYRPRQALFDLAHEPGRRWKIGCLSPDGDGDGVLAAELNRHRPDCPSSRFLSAAHASDFLLGMEFSAAVRPNGRVQLQPIDHAPWEANFVELSERRFAFLERIERWLGTELEFDSALHLQNLSPLWRATQCL